MVRLPVMDSVRAAVAFARARIGRVAGVLALVMVLDIATAMAANGFAFFMTLLAAFLAGLMANAALLRMAFADEHPGDAEFRIGPQGLQFAAPELRLLGAVLLLTLFGLIGAVFLTLLAALVDVGLIFSHGGGAALTPELAAKSPELQMSSAVLLLIFSAVGIWVWLRVFTYPAATIAEKRVQVFSTWRLTRRQAPALFCAVLIVVSPVLVIDGLSLALHGQPGVIAVLTILSAAVHAFVEMPLLCGLSSHVYKALRRPATAVAPPLATGAPAGLAGPWG